MLVVGMAAFLFVVGYALGEVLSPGRGTMGLFIAFVIWIILTLISYASGNKIFLAMSRARKIDPKDHPILYNVVEEMQIAFGLSKTPDIYIIDDPAPNAFATGRNPQNAAVAVTSGILLRSLHAMSCRGSLRTSLHISTTGISYT